MSKLIAIELKGSDCLCEVLAAARKRQRRTVKTPLDLVNKGTWTGDSCRTSSGEWGTIQPDGTCKVNRSNLTDI